MNWGNYTWLPGVILAVVAIIAAFIYYRNTRKTKTLDYQIVANQLIVSDYAQSVAGLEVTVGGARIKSPRLLTVRYKNTGNEPIEASDFVRPISLTPDVRVYSISIDETPINVRVDLGNASGVQSILPDVVNKGEYFDASYLIDSVTGDFKPSYRYKGATRSAQDFGRREERRAIAAVLSVPIVVAGVFLVALLIVGPSSSTVTSFLLLGAAVTLANFVVEVSQRFVRRLWKTRRSG